MNKLSEQDVFLNAPFEKNIFDQDGNIVLKKGHVFRTYAERKAWVEHGIFVSENEDALPSVQQKPHEIVRSVHDELKVLFDNISTGKNGNVKDIILSCARKLIQCNDDDIEEATGWILLEGNIRHALLRAIHCAMIAGKIGKSLSYEANKIEAVVAAALTMNISILEDQDRWDRDKAVISMNQRLQILNHPKKSVEILIKHGVDDKVWLDAIAHHHEERDGKGYPNSISGDSIPETASLLHLCDIYVAAISGRAHRSGKSTEQAIKDLLVSQTQRFIAGHVRSLLRDFGYFPCGTYVEISNGLMGVVSRRNGEASDVIAKTEKGKIERFICLKGTPTFIVRSAVKDENATWATPTLVWS